MGVLMVLLLLAGTGESELRLRAAQRIAALYADDVRELQAGSGAVSARELARAQRAELDARAVVARLEGKPSALLAVQRRIEELESRRLKAARALYDNGTLDKLSVLQREGEYITVVRERVRMEEAARIADPGKKRRYLSEHRQKTARLLLQVADERLKVLEARFREGQLDAQRLSRAKIDKSDAETALALARYAAEPERAAIARMLGAERRLQFATEEAALMLQRFEQGIGPLFEAHAAERRALDAKLALFDAKQLIEKQSAKERLAVLRSIEQLEAKRLAGARKRHTTGTIGYPAVVERQLAHQLAWIARDCETALAKNPDRSAQLAANRDRQQAKVRLMAANEMLKFLEDKGEPARIRAARREQIQAETDLAIAKEQLRAAEK